MLKKKIDSDSFIKISLNHLVFQLQHLKLCYNVIGSENVVLFIKTLKIFKSIKLPVLN